MGVEWESKIEEEHGSYKATVFNKQYPTFPVFQVYMYTEQDIHDIQGMIDELDNKLLGLLGQLEKERETNE